MVSETAGNERNMNRTLKAILLSAGLCSLPNLCFPASIVYDNTATDLSGQYSPSSPGLEFGDQITLTNNSDRILSQFNFYSFLTAPSASTQRVTLRLYANTGVTNSPAALPFYTSDLIQLTNGFGNYGITFPLSSNQVFLPNTFTWTVQFSNLGPGQTGSLLLYGPPTVGSSLDDFWQRDGTGAWGLRQVSGSLSDFAARVSAVPEPGVLPLGGLGVLLLAALRRFRKRPG